MHDPKHDVCIGTRANLLKNALQHAKFSA